MKVHGSIMNVPVAKIIMNCFKHNFHDSGAVGKVSAVRKKITRASVEILEAKSAASVLKRLNWENRQLFGDVIKNGKSKVKKTELRNKIKNFKIPIIQYDPVLLISKENIVSGTSNCSLSELDSSKDNITVSPYSGKSSSQNILNSILKFPLLNNGRKENFENEVNVLSQHLQEICSSIPSVTTVLDQTMPLERAVALEKWKKHMIEEMGKEKFDEYQKEILSSGSSFHSTVNAFLRGVPEEEITIHGSNQGHWKSVQSIFPDIQAVKLLEEWVTHPFLQYRGIVDCIAQYRNQLVVTEWKTSKKPKSTLRSTYDSPLQLAAYIGALNFDPRFQYMVDKGLIVIVYEGGSPAHSHFLQKEVLNEYWMEWLKRLKKYWELLK